VLTFIPLVPGEHHPLRAAWDSIDPDVVRVAAAFGSESGAHEFRKIIGADAFDAAQKTWLIGIQQGITQPEALRRLRSFGSSEVRVPYGTETLLTVHKAQGSDFGIVFFVLPQTRLLSRELLYTGLTRSKHKLVLLVEGDDVSGLYELTLPSRSETARRNTNLFRSVVREEAEQAPYAEHLIHRVSDGRMVRSKSELAVAIELQRLGMWDRCYYERPLDGPATGGRFRPDFTFIDAGGDPIIWEHLGMLDKESYRRSWEWKLEWYKQNGYQLGENLFTTEDGPDGALDQTAITAVAQELEELL
jgi:UvrD-like helicase C-terminal domain